MHETYTALALARHNAWVLLSRLFEFLLIQLLRCLAHVLALEVLDPKLDAA